jgi:hypothetical protein
LREGYRHIVRLGKAFTRGVVDEELDDELNRLLNRQEPWKPSLFDCVGVDKPPEWMTSRDNPNDWHEAFKIVDALDRAAGLKP